MLSRRILLSVFALVLAAGMAWSGDVTGTWTAEFTTPRGDTRESTFVFEVAGEELTGTVSGPRGETPIEDGKVEGESITFTVTRDFGRGDMKFLYEGTLSADEIEMTVTIEGRDRTFDMTARRVAE
jgi:hypothetical protein